MEKINSLTNDNNKKLVVHTIGSTETVQKANTIYEYDDEIVVVDCGIGYPDMDMPGVDVLIPDFTYLLENSTKIKGLFITHAHADHIGAVPYLLQELPDIHIYGSQLVIEMIKSSLTDRNFKHLAEGTHFHLLDPSVAEISFKYFKIKAFGINHSVPESQGYSINTPEGRLLHIADYKFDATPVLDKPFDTDTVSKYGDEGVLALLSDCLAVNVKGSIESEATLNNTFFEILEKAGNRQVFITVLSSNISRMFQIVTAAVKYGRRIVASGRSIESVIAISRKIGYLPFADDHFVSEQEASSFDQGSLVYIIAGCYGQPESSLGRLSRHEHKDIELKDQAIVVFSGDPGPPEVNVTVERLTDALILAGVEVIDSSIQDNLHVSGHGGQMDMIRLASLVKPKYFIPIGGTVTKMRKYRNLMSEIGFDKNNVFECLEGDALEFSKGVGKKGVHIEVSPVYISTGRGDEIAPQVMRDRDTLASDGVFVVVIGQNKKTGQIDPNVVEIVTRGFIYVKDSRDLMDQSKKFITKTIAKRTVGKTGKDVKEWADIRRGIEKDIDRFLYTKTGRSPLIIVHSLPM